MSESNEALQALQASVDHLKQAVDANASSQAGDTAVLFTVLSLVLAELPPDTRNLIEDSFSVWANGLPNAALSKDVKQIARQRLAMTPRTDRGTPRLRRVRPGPCNPPSPAAAHASSAVRAWWRLAARGTRPCRACVAPPHSCCL